MEANNKSAQISLARRVESGEINLKGSKAYLLKHLQEHPTFKTISEAHNRHFGISIKK